jgi:glycerol-3-phosphate O-acyltransferase / dihydroxyacetone phosphate acyltransferase
VHGFIGWASRQVGSVPVGRAQDSAKPGPGTIYLPDPINDPTLIRGIGTKFDDGQAAVGGSVFLPSAKGQSGSNMEIAEVVGPEELRIKRPFKGKLPMQQLTGRDDIDEQGEFANKDQKGAKESFEGTKYKLAPHIDQTKVYEAIFDRLKSGGTVGIFPEGGSHDRTELLPLKAGVAIMALGTLAEAPDCGLQIVPVGMNYFHAHKFRSRAVIEFGPPFSVPDNLVEMYKTGQRRDAIAQLLDMVYQALSAVTVSVPDYDTLMMLQAARRLYAPVGKKLPLPVVVELNRRLAQGYEKYKDDDRIKKATADVKAYNSQLRWLGVRDHQVQYAKLSLPKVIFLFIYRLSKLLLLSIGVLPGLVLFSPVFVASKVISRRKAKEALAGSSVKIQGRDVMATWKLLVAMAFAPILYNVYTVLLAYMVHQDRLWGYVPDWVPLWLVFIVGWIVFPAITFAALRFGEVGMDIFKSLRPLALCMLPSSSSNIHSLRERRSQLSAEVTDLINTLGPEMFPDFEHTRLVPDPNKSDSGKRPSSSGAGRPQSPSGTLEGQSTHGGISGPTVGPGAPLQRTNTRSSQAIPRNASFSNIGQVGMFSSATPPSGSRSRSSSSGGGLNSGGFPISGFTSLDSKEGFDEASKKLREAMKEKGEIRRRKSLDAATAEKEANKSEAQDEASDDEDGEVYEEARKKNA